MVIEAAAPTTATTGVPGVVVGQQPGLNRCHSNCLATLYPASIASRLLPHLPSQFQSRPGCWPASKCGNSTYPFAKAPVAANDSGNIPGKKKEY